MKEQIKNPINKSINDVLRKFRTAKKRGFISLIVEFIVMILSIIVLILFWPFGWFYGICNHLEYLIDESEKDLQDQRQLEKGNPIPYVLVYIAYILVYLFFAFLTIPIFILNGISKLLSKI